MSTLFAPNDLPQDHEFYGLSLIPTKKKRLKTVLVSPSLEEALAQMLLLKAPGTTYGIDRGEYYCQGTVTVVGHCGFLRKQNTQTRHDVCNFDRSVHQCIFPGCLAEYEFRAFSKPGDTQPNLERPGVLLVKAPNYPPVGPAGPASKPYGQFGFFQEHRHFDNAEIKSIPRALHARKDSYIRSRVHHRSPTEAANNILEGLDDIRHLVFDKLKALCSRSISRERKRQADESPREMLTPDGASEDGGMDVEVNEGFINIYTCPNSRNLDNFTVNPSWLQAEDKRVFGLCYFSFSPLLSHKRLLRLCL